MKNITREQSNYFTLHKQHLTEDSKTDNIIQIVKDIGGLHATSSTTPYISLFARTKNFTKEDLDRELYVKKNLGKIRCVRKTVYILTREMIPIAYSATKNMIEPTSEHYATYLGVNKKQYQQISKQILKILKGKGMTTNEIKKSLNTKLNISAIVNLMCDQGLLIRGKPKKGWKSNIHTYYLLNEYFPSINLNSIEEAKARKLLVKHYINSFGPVTETDIAWWTGLPKGQVKQILENLKDQTSRLTLSNTEDTYILLRPDEKLLQTLKPKEKHTVNLLPSLDPYLMGYKERQRYLDQDHYDKVFDRSGNATSTILLDGKVVGVWDFTETPEPTVKIHLFKEAEETLAKEIRAKAQAIGKFIASKDVRIKECDAMTPLTQRTAGAVMSPLKKC